MIWKIELTKGAGLNLVGGLLRQIGIGFGYPGRIGRGLYPPFAWVYYKNLSSHADGLVGGVKDFFGRQPIAVPVAKDSTTNPTENAVFGDADFEDAEVNPAVAEGMTQGASKDTQLSRDIKMRLRDEFVGMRSDWPEPIARLFLSSSLKQRSLEDALVDLWGRTDIWLVPTDTGLFINRDGKKFAAGHFGLGGEGDQRKHDRPSIYLAVDRNGDPLFDFEELIVIAAHELVHLLFKERGLSQDGVHDLARIYHQRISLANLGLADAVDKKFAKLRAENAHKHIIRTPAQIDAGIDLIMRTLQANNLSPETLTITRNVLQTIVPLIVRSVPSRADGQEPEAYISNWFTEKTVEEPRPKTFDARDWHAIRGPGHLSNLMVSKDGKTVYLVRENLGKSREATGLTTSGQR